MVSSKALPIIFSILLNVSTTLPIVAVPALRLTVTAFSAAKLAVSVPSPPIRVSAPGPPISSSFPALPVKVSLPEEPSKELAFPSPVSISFADVPSKFSKFCKL